MNIYRNTIFVRLTYTIMLFVLFLSAGCGKKHKQYTIGLIMAENGGRWDKDVEYFTAKVDELGHKSLVGFSGFDSDKQLAMCRDFIGKGIDILVFVPADSKKSADIVDLAHKNNIKVIAYDRLAVNSPVDMYISFDNQMVGKLQAEYLIKLKPEGRWALIGGSPKDNNAAQIREGQMQVLKPFIDSAKIEIAADFWVDDWNADIANAKMTDVLKTDTAIDVALASNDNVAEGVLKAFNTYKKTPVLISGQDADLKSCVRIVSGKQTMTVFKSIIDLAHTAAEAAIGLIEAQKVPQNLSVINNGDFKTPVVFLKPVTVDKLNIDDVVFSSQFHSKKEIFGSTNESK